MTVNPASVQLARRRASRIGRVSCSPWSHSKSQVSSFGRRLDLGVSSSAKPAAPCRDHLLQCVLHRKDRASPPAMRWAPSLGTGGRIFRCHARRGETSRGLAGPGPPSQGAHRALRECVVECLLAHIRLQPRRDYASRADVHRPEPSPRKADKSYERGLIAARYERQIFTWRDELPSSCSL